jgi:hypothetical protein
MSKRAFLIVGVLGLAWSAAACSSDGDDDATEGDKSGVSGTRCELVSPSEVSSTIDRPDLAVSVTSHSERTTQCGYYPQDLSDQSSVIVIRYEECTGMDWFTNQRELLEGSGYATEDLAEVGDAAYNSENLASAIQGTMCVTTSSAIIPIEDTIEVLELAVSKL